MLLHMHTMQQTHTYKAITRQDKAKKLLSRRGQLDYSSIVLCYSATFFTQMDSLNPGVIGKLARLNGLFLFLKKKMHFQ